MGEAKNIYFTCLKSLISKATKAYLIYPYESNQLRQNYGSYTEFLWHVWKRIYCYSRGNTSRGDFLILLQWNRCQGGICLVPLLFAASVLFEINRFLDGVASPGQQLTNLNIFTLDIFCTRS